jgi:hypothetical protein
MRRSLIALLLALASMSVAPAPPAVADDPGPTVILGPPPFAGPDAMIRADGSTTYAGAGTRGGGRIEQTITQFERAVSDIRICAHNTHGRMRVEGTSGGRSFRVKYRVAGRDVTRSIVAGTYRTRQLQDGTCARRIHVVVRLKPWTASDGRIFRIRAASPAGQRDSVATDVRVVGPFVLP